MNIEIVSGSPRKESISYKEALFLKNLLQQKTTHLVNLIDVRDWPLSPMQQVVYSSVDNTPEELKPLAERMLIANAFIIVTPEYNGSYTAAIKNLFDYFPKQMHKAFGIVTASQGNLGGIRASQQLQLLIGALFGIPSPYMLVTPQVDKKFDENANLTDGSFQHSVNTFIHEFLWLAEKLAAA